MEQKQKSSEEAQREADEAEIARFRKLIGVDSLEREVAYLRGELMSVGEALRTPQQPSSGGPYADLLKDPMVQQLLGGLVAAFTKFVGGGGGEESQISDAEKRRRSLFDKIQQRYEDRLIKDMESLADRIVAGEGLLVEEKEPQVSQKALGKPDGVGKP